MGKDEENIPSVPVANVDLNDQTGLKNLAGWIARYKNFGLTIDEVSPFIEELLENGTLTQFEPSLIGLKVGQWGGHEEYERYEFTAVINDFAKINDGSLDYVNLHFCFQSNNKCLMFITSVNQSESNKLPDALETTFRALGVEPLTKESDRRDIVWQEADEIILKYLKYIKSPDIPSVPE
ncbi:MAG: hypothetical protein WDK96_03185 [Candidatus Paceibacterota bacterium]|jgi:hypothetical protein